MLTSQKLLHAHMAHTKKQPKLKSFEWLRQVSEVREFAVVFLRKIVTRLFSADQYSLIPHQF